MAYFNYLLIYLDKKKEIERIDMIRSFGFMMSHFRMPLNRRLKPL